MSSSKRTINSSSAFPSVIKHKRVITEEYLDSPEYKAIKNAYQMAVKEIIGNYILDSLK